MKIFYSFEKSGLLIKAISEAIKYEAKKQKYGFITILLGTVAACLLGSALTGWVIGAGKENIRGGQNF